MCTALSRIASADRLAEDISHYCLFRRSPHLHSQHVLTELFQSVVPCAKRGRYVSKRPDGLRVDRDGCMKLDAGARDEKSWQALGRGVGGGGWEERLLLCVRTGEEGIPKAIAMEVHEI